MNVDPVVAELRRIRLARGLTMLDIYERGGPSTAVLSRIENGRVGPMFHTVRQLAGVLDLDVVLVDELSTGLSPNRSQARSAAYGTRDALVYKLVTERFAS
jgi:transcriptional regulator with XRE-family HTH domain